MTEPARKKSSKASHPKIKALNWEDLDPTQLIDRSIEKLKEATRNTRETCESHGHHEPKPA
jgi:hypothetical protein